LKCASTRSSPTAGPGAGAIVDVLEHASGDCHV
jgi:hypothetical protein